MIMEQGLMIKEGDWFCAIEGLAIADKIYNFYFEEFDKIPQNKVLGDYKMSVIQYRLFCDFYTLLSRLEIVGLKKTLNSATL